MYKLWARIKGKDYPIAYGSTITDTFSETLDSATIILPHVMEVIDIKPYDDVIIHSDEYDVAQGKRVQWCLENHSFQTVYDEGNATAESPHSKVYRHMLCETPQRRQVNFDGEYTYTLSCVSETKGLEFAQMPNRTITQPKVADVSLVGELDQETSVTSHSFSPSNPAQELRSNHAEIKTGTLEIPLSDWSTVVLFDVTTNEYSGSVQQIKWTSSWLAMVGSAPYEDGGSGSMAFQSGSSKNISFGRGRYSVKLQVIGNEIYAKGSWESAETITTLVTRGPKSIYFWINAFVNSYSPKVKYKVGENTWEYRKKYIIGNDVSDKFGHTKCPEMTFQGSTLREALTQLMSVLDCIPVVHDNVIGFLDLSQRNAKFSERRAEMRAILNAEGITNEVLQDKYPSFCEHEGKDQIPNQSWNTWTMSGGEYADRLRTEYSGAISEQNSTRYVEKKGFRNMNASSMQLNSLRIELSHPIYKINKIYLEYYKKSISDSSKAILVKYDITPLVKLNSERQMLSHDWTSLANNNFTDYNNNGFLDINDFANYYFFTIGYNIGSNFIDGWGESLNFSKDGVLSQQHSVLENIIVLTSMLSYYGDSSLMVLPTQVGQETLMNMIDFGNVSNMGWNQRSGYSAIKELASNIVTPAGMDNTREMFLEAVRSTVDLISEVFTGTPALTDYTQILKSVFFEIDYEGMISGAVISTKDYHDGDIVRRDAVSSALPVIELAGSLEKQKANKLGNATVVNSQRVDRREFLMKIGDYDEYDQIIYQRTVSYDRDYLKATYYQCKDFVLKNYYTSVFARIRPFSLSSYGESTTRNENHYEVALFSTDKWKYQSDSENFDKGFSVADAVSFLFPNAVFSWEAKKESNIVPIVRKVNEIGYAIDYDAYLLEKQNYISGNSLCMTFTMPDSVSMGTYIKNWNPSVIEYIKEKYFQSGVVASSFSKEDATAFSNNQEFLQELSGTIQAWHMIQTDVEPINLSFANMLMKSSNDVFGDDGREISSSTVMNEIYQKLMNIPKLPYSFQSENEMIRFHDTMKDQKERLNSTAQLELISENDDIFITEWAARLSDAGSNKKKAWEYKKDSVIWFWIMKTSYVISGNDSAVARFGSTFIKKWKTTWSNPVLSLPVLMVVTNTESDDVMLRLANQTIAVNKTITWNSYSVFVSSVSFDSNGLASSMKIKESSSSASETTIYMADMNSDGSTVGKVETTGALVVNDVDPDNQNTRLANWCHYNVSTIKNAPAVSNTYAQQDKEMSFSSPYFRKFRIAKSLKMWFSDTTLFRFLLDEQSIRHPVFFRGKYTVIDIKDENASISDYAESYTDENMKTQWKFKPQSMTVDTAIANMYISKTALSMPDTWVLRNNVFAGTNGASDFAYSNTTMTAAYIHKPRELVSIGSGTLTITYSHNRIDAREADSLIACSGIPFGETFLTDVKINNQSIELSNRTNLLASIADGDLTITAEGDVSEGGSIRVYYKDSDEGGDGMTHLVFAINAYSVSNGIVSAHIYVSILDDRTETVIDSHGEPSYRVANFAEDDFDSLGNYCVAKSSD